MVEYPKNEALEKIVLASMINSEQVREEASFALTEKSFYSRVHRELFLEIRKVHLNGDTPDYILVEQNCGETVKTILADIWFNTSSYKNAHQHISGLKEVEGLRTALLNVGKISQIIAQAGEEGDYSGKLAEVRELAEGFDEVVTDNTGLTHVADLSASAYNEFVEAQNPNSDRMVMTGIGAIDGTVGGFKKKEYVVIAGRSGQGKSSLALSIMLNMGRKGVDAGLFTLEMPDDTVVNKLISMESLTCGDTVTGDHLRGKTKASASVHHAYIEAKEKVDKYSLFFDDAENHSIDTIESSLRTFIRKNNLDVVFIDYISLINTKGVPKAQRNEVISELSKRFMKMFKKLDVVGVVLVQLTRDAQNNKPILSNLKESGQIENDANTVIMLHRYDMTRFDEAELIINKARGGGMGDYPVHFCTDTTYMRDMTTGERQIYNDVRKSGGQRADVQF